MGCKEVDMTVNILMLIFSLSILQIPLPLVPLATIGNKRLTATVLLIIYESIVVSVSVGMFYYFQFVR